MRLLAWLKEIVLSLNHNEEDEAVISDEEAYEASFERLLKDGGELETDPPFDMFE